MNFNLTNIIEANELIEVLFENNPRPVYLSGSFSKRVAISGYYP